MFSPALFSTGRVAVQYYISTNGNDFLGLGTFSKPFRTIQKAIDIARDGDIIIVLEGRYGGQVTGSGLQGEGLTVQSRNQRCRMCRFNLCWCWRAGLSLGLSTTKVRKAF
jgi:hypothetical protein